MPRYIDADEAIRLSKEDKLAWVYDLTDLEEFLVGVPTADVVPKVELDAMRGAANSYKMHYDELKALYENLLADVRENAIRDICEICKYHDEHPDCPADCMECDLTDKCHCYECLNCCGWVWRGEVDATDTNVGVKVSSSEICVVCGEHVPEGRQICSMCETGREFLNKKKG